MNNSVFEGTMKYTLIYIFSIDDEAHRGYLKIGEHKFESSLSYKQLEPNSPELNRQAKLRIDEYTKTALIKYKLLHTELARISVKLDDGTIETRSFSDHKVHEVLDQSGFDVHKFYDTGRSSEWYKVDLPTAVSAIKAVKKGRKSLAASELNSSNERQNDMDELPVSEYPIIKLRQEQNDCVTKTKRVFTEQNRMLWDCKMRFGKTITAYELIKEMNYQKVLVVTHRPAVVDGWQSDFKLMFQDNRVFITKPNIKHSNRFTEIEEASIDAENDRQLNNLVSSKTPFVYFTSIQDLRGSSFVGGKYSKNKAVFNMDWDLIIYDEAHEGTQTELGIAVQQLLEQPKNGKKPVKVLQLSGTPYNLLNQYSEDNVFKWDYVMEQQAKKQWDSYHPGDHNPYLDLPELKIYTFDLQTKLDRAYRYSDENVAFNFREFFRTWTGNPKRDFQAIPEGSKIGDFVHVEDVQNFLDLISTESDINHYPFSTREYRDLFKHTFWILPGVKEAGALSALLKRHPIFKEYEIVNIAGEGDVEQPYDDALSAVRSAIKNHDKTITLSCGRLTTGITVKEWTGVMLLSGSSNTGAAGYMQTIFRVQSAGTIDGKQKMVCYAFDFAPDRALKVIADIHKLKGTAQSSDEEYRTILGEFLNFCPILAETDSGMKPYDVPHLMQQLKRITVDSAIKSGFDDNSIYKSDAGLVMDKNKLRLLEQLKGRLTPKKKSHKKRKIKINDQGFTEEEYEKYKKVSRKPKKKLTPEEREIVEKAQEQRKVQKILLDLLRNVSIRLPLLIYGTANDFDESIKLAEFVDKVDDASWLEFMPKEISKELFLDLLTFYDEDVVEAAGKRIRQMAKAADDLMPTQRVKKIAEIFSYFKNPAKETVLTPWRAVNMHLGKTLGGYNFFEESYPEDNGYLEEPRLIEKEEITNELFGDHEVAILEMNSKSGLYPLYMAYSLYRKLLPKEENSMTLEEARYWWEKALYNHVYVLCQTAMAVSITKRTLVGYTDMKVNVIYLSKLLDRMKDIPRLIKKITNLKTWGKEGEHVQFQAIIGNPPYQLIGGAGGTNDAPIYQHFINTAKQMEPNYITFIMPSRWFSAGRENLIGEFRQEMLLDKAIREMYVYPDSQDVFPSVDIKGGVCFFLRNKKYFGDCRYELHEEANQMLSLRDLGDFDILIRDPRLNDIVKKVMDSIGSDGQTVDLLVSADTPFGIPTNPFKNNKSKIPVYREKTNEHNTELYFIENSHRNIAYVDESDITKNRTDIDKYKVLIPKASGSGSDAKVLGKPILAPRNSVSSQSFLYVPFDSIEEAENFISYLKTKLFRVLVSACKISQDAPSKAYRFVPAQDFSKPWTDKELYKQYNLTDEEIRFIEANIMPLD